MRSPTAWVDEVLMTRWLARRDRIDSMFVRGDRRLIKRQMWWVAAKFVIGLGLIVLIGQTTDVGRLWGGSVVLALGLLVGAMPMYNVARAQSYRNGWIEGRQATRASYGEAQSRGLSSDEWIAGEYERDFKVF